MHRTSPAHATSANSAALILLRIGFTTLVLLAALFLLLTQTHNLPFGKFLAFATVAIGFLFLIAALGDLLKELNRQADVPLPRSSKPQRASSAS
jgi:hypothetical protein